VSTTKQKEAAKKNIGKAREIQSERAHGAKIPRQSPGMTTSAKDKLPDNVFAFPKERKEPLTDAKHVRSAIARFDQVEGISDKEKDAAWNRILKAAKKCDVDVHESSWRELGQGMKGQAAKSRTISKSRMISKSPSAKSPTSKSPSSKSPSAKSKASMSQASKPKAAAGKK
jgi:hypothetical protein